MPAQAAQASCRRSSARNFAIETPQVLRVELEQYYLVLPLRLANRSGGVHHEAGFGRAVPMALVGRDPDHVACADGLWNFSLHAHQSVAGHDLKDLAVLMHVPEGARACGEKHVRAMLNKPHQIAQTG